jgi:FkbM family methyltransferase
MATQIGNFDGLYFKHRIGTNDRLVIGSVYQENHYEFPEDMKGKVVIDVGANIGSISVFTASRGATVYAIEPYSENFKLLQENIRLNHLNDKIKPFKLAIGVEGQSKLFVNEKRPDFCSLDVDVNPLSNDEYEMVEVVTLESFMDRNDIQSCDVLKLDAEGAEVEIADEINLGLHNRIATVCAELHYWEEPILHLRNRELDILKKYYNLERKISDYEFFLKHK